MTIAEKTTWLENATATELLNQYVSLINCDRFGCNAEDIALTKAEILRRMESH